MYNRIVLVCFIFALFISAMCYSNEFEANMKEIPKEIQAVKEKIESWLIKDVDPTIKELDIISHTVNEKPIVWEKTIKMLRKKRKKYEIIQLEIIDYDIMGQYRNNNYDLKRSINTMKNENILPSVVLIKPKYKNNKMNIKNDYLTVIALVGNDPNKIKILNFFMFFKED
jgi:hypothetical protein